MNRKPWLICAFALALFSSCASTFALQVQTTDAQQVGSVFVLFGDASDFKGKDETRAIVHLIQSSSLDKYVGYVEYELSGTGDVANWVELSSSLRDEIKVEIDPKTPGVLSFQVDRDLLEIYPKMGVALVLRTTENTFHLKPWGHAFVAEAEKTLVITLTGEEIKESQL